MCGSMVDIQSATTENSQEKKKEETTAAKYNGLSYWAAIISQLRHASKQICY